MTRITRMGKGVQVVAGGPVVPPDDLFGSNLIGWWDAADGMTGGVAADRTAGAHNLTSWGTEGVTVQTDLTDFGNAPFYNFPFGNALVAGGSRGALAFPSIGSAGAFFVAVNTQPASNDFGRLFSLCHTTGGPDYDSLSSISGYYLPPASTTAANSAGITCNLVGAQGAPGTVPTGDHLQCYAWGGTSENVYSDNVTIASGSVGGTINIGGGGNLALTIGSSVDGSGQFVGRMMFAFLVNITPSPAQRTAVYNYYLSLI